jgi:hypothetical protein
MTPVAHIGCPEFFNMGSASGEGRVVSGYERGMNGHLIHGYSTMNRPACKQLPSGANTRKA